MNQDTAKINETPELKDTEITIRIRTGIMHRNKADEAQTRIGYTGFYISAINYFIRIALEAQSHLTMQTDSVVIRNDEQFRENLQFLIQIQEALTEWLPDYSNALFDGARTTEPPEVLDLSAQSEDCQRLNKLAVSLSEVMNNPLTPPVIYNNLSDVLIEIPFDTNSPEWILGNLKKMREALINE